MADFNSFFNNYLFFKFISKCQKESLRCAPPSHVCDFLLIVRFHSNNNNMAKRSNGLTQVFSVVKWANTTNGNLLFKNYYYQWNFVIIIPCNCTIWMSTLTPSELSVTWWAEFQWCHLYLSMVLDHKVSNANQMRINNLQKLVHVLDVSVTMKKPNTYDYLTKYLLKILLIS